MIAIRSTRHGATRLGVLAFASAAVVVIPTVAVAADGGTPTIRSTIGADGAVQDTTEYTPDGTSRSYDGEQPVAMDIGHTSSGAAQTFTYRVQNTFSETQLLNYFDTDGNAHKTSVQLQLPLVAQLGVDVPKSMGAVTAPNAIITTSADGTRHVLWNLILFAPIGSPVQDVTLTTAAAGTPVAELRATPVDPASTPGLSGSSQAASAGYQQDDFWATYAGGANDGLTQIKDGLSQLLAGIVEGADGAQQLADGSAEAYSGSKELSDGMGLIYDGQSDLTKGLVKINDGQGELTTGLRKIHNGQGDLTDGISQIYDGQTALTGGLAQISGGLDQVVDPATGLPAAVAGIQQVIDGIQDGTANPDLVDGVDALIAGIGSAATNGTLLNGIAQVKGGLAQLEAGIQTNAACAVSVLTKLMNGSAGEANPCVTGGVLPPLPAMTDPFAVAVMSGLISQFSAVAAGTDATLVAAFAGLNGGLDLVSGGLQQVKAGLSTGDLGNPGVREGLLIAKGGLQQIKAGVSSAVDGLNLLDAGAAQALDGSQQLADGSASALDGSQQLYDGSGDALSGSRQLTDGSGQALDGSQQLTDGSGKAFAGSKDLVDGLGQIADGQRQVADGLPAAVDGIGQLIDGVGQAQDSAVAPLTKQLKQDSLNSHKQLAIIQAAGALGAKSPAGPGATYVLTQSTRDFALAADSGGDSNTGRNIGIGAGGAVLLLVGLGTGLAMGRRNSRVAA